MELRQGDDNGRSETANILNTLGIPGSQSNVETNSAEQSNVEPDSAEQSNVEPDSADQSNVEPNSADQSNVESNSAEQSTRSGAPEEGEMEGVEDEGGVPLGEPANGENSDDFEDSRRQAEFSALEALAGEQIVEQDLREVEPGSTDQDLEGDLAMTNGTAVLGLTASRHAPGASNNSEQPSRASNSSQQMPRASDRDYQAWVAEGRPKCKTCKNRHAPPCIYKSKPPKRKSEDGHEASSSGRRREGRDKDWCFQCGESHPWEKNGQTFHTKIPNKPVGRSAPAPAPPGSAAPMTATPSTLPARPTAASRPAPQMAAANPVARMEAVNTAPAAPQTASRPAGTIIQQMTQSAEAGAQVRVMFADSLSVLTTDSARSDHFFRLFEQRGQQPSAPAPTAAPAQSTHASVAASGLSQGRTYDFPALPPVQNRTQQSLRGQANTRGRGGRGGGQPSRGAHSTDNRGGQAGGSQPSRGAHSTGNRGGQAGGSQHPTTRGTRFHSADRVSHQAAGGGRGAKAPQTDSAKDKSKNPK